MSVCINPFYIEKAKEFLKGSDVKVCTVIGFPLGQMTKEMKAEEAFNAVKHGAEEVDMVINVAKAKENDFTYIEDEIRTIKQSIGSTLLKVILENCYLSKEQIKGSSLAAKRAGADYVKTSTGFGPGGATIPAAAVSARPIPPPGPTHASSRRLPPAPSRTCRSATGRGAAGRQEPSVLRRTARPAPSSPP